MKWHPYKCNEMRVYNVWFVNSLTALLSNQENDLYLRHKNEQVDI